MILWFCLLPIMTLAVNRIVGKSRSQPFVQLSVLNDHNLMHYVAISFDTHPLITKKVLIDTGSNDLWIYMNKSEIQSWAKHIAEETSVSLDYVLSQKNEMFEIRYQSADVKGIITSRSVNMNHCNLKNSRVGTVFYDDTTNRAFGNSPIEGVFGLGLSGLNYEGNPTPFEEIYHANCIKEFVFSLLLPNNDMVQGYLVIGGINKRFTQGDVKFYPLVSGKYWEIELSAIKVAGKDIADCQSNSTTNCRVIFDSGTTGLAGPSRIIGQLREILIAASKMSYSLLPTISITFGDTDYELGPEDYMLYEGDNIQEREIPLEEKKVALMPIDLSIGDNIFVLGAIFMKKYVTVYDGVRSEIGIAEKNPSWYYSDDDLKTISELNEIQDLGQWNKVYGKEKIFIERDLKV